MKRLLTVSIYFLLALNLRAQYKGRVIAIADGDSFTILREGNKQEKIRLYGIDCPEKGQPYGRNAKLFLSQLVFNKEVTIINKGKDRYSRTVAIVYKEGQNICEALLKAGLAWHFRRYDQNPVWEALEKQARISKKGLWADPGASEPWLWRKQGGRR